MHPQVRRRSRCEIRQADLSKAIQATLGADPRTSIMSLSLHLRYTTEALETLVELMREGKDERERGTAAQALLDRGWGKPKVEVLTDKSDYLTALLEVQNSIIEHRSQSGHNSSQI